MVKLGKTWSDMESTPREVSWRAIRSLRANPPGRAIGDRQPTFTTALEQAQQLFSAAAGIEPAARPLALFYGLSQAGRALAAARGGNPWTFRTHGIGEDTTNTPATTVAEFRIEPHKSGTGAFNVVASALKSSSLPGPTRLGDLWNLIPDTWRFELPGSGPHRLLHIDFDRDQPGAPVNGTLSNLPASLAAPRSAGDDPSAPRTDWTEEQDRVRDYLTSYPSLAGYEFTTGRGQPIGLQTYDNETASVRIYWPSTPKRIVTADERRKTVAATYLGHTNVYPSIDGARKPLHPLVTWWALLFGLSILARYEPEAWGRAIDINQSPEAVAIEHLLESALDSLPELLYRALTGIV